MQRSLFILGTLLVAGWLLLLFSVPVWWKVQAVECRHPQRSCTDQEVSALHSFQGRRVLFSDSKYPDLPPELGVVVSSTRVRWPATAEVWLVDQRLELVLQVGTDRWAVTDRQTYFRIDNDTLGSTVPQVRVESAEWSTWQAQPEVLWANVAKLKALTAVLTEEEGDVWWRDSQTLTLQAGDKQLIVDPDDWQIGWQRWQALRDNLEWESINASILEVDTRYNLPVLRSTVSLPRHSS